MPGIRLLLEEYIKADEQAKVIQKSEAQKRIEALREVFANWSYKTADQLQEAMTVAHFTAYFSDALSRMFYDSYQYQNVNWRDYTYPDTSPDFRKVKRFRQSQPGTLRRRREKAEQKQTSVSHGEVDWGVEEFSEGFDVSWQALLNDDLGAIRRVPMDMVAAARRFEDEFVSALYDNATTQAALVALGAGFAGTGRISEANLATGITAMRTRTDADGNKLQINGIWLVIPAESEIDTLKVLESANIAGSMDNDKNVVPRFLKGYRVNPYITTSGANRPWYLVADPREIPVITVGRLQGWDQPVVYRKRSDIEMIQGNVPAPFLLGSYESGDIEYTVQDVIGGWDDDTYVGVTDYRGIYYSSGTTA